MGNVFGCKKKGSIPVRMTMVDEAAPNMGDAGQVPGMNEYFAESYGKEHGTPKSPNPGWLPQVPTAPPPLRKRSKKLRNLGKHWNTSAMLARGIHRWKLLLLFSTPPKQIAQVLAQVATTIPAHINVVFNRKGPWGVGFSGTARGAAVTALEETFIRNSFECYRSANNAQDAGVRIGDLLTAINGENISHLPYLALIRKVKSAKLPCTLSFVGERAETASGTNLFASLPFEMPSKPRLASEAVVACIPHTHTDDEISTARSNSSNNSTDIDVEVGVLFATRETPWCVGLTSLMSFSRATVIDHCPDDCDALVAVLEDYTHTYNLEVEACHDPNANSIPSPNSGSGFASSSGGTTIRVESHSRTIPNRARAAGVQIGDRLVSVNGSNVEGWPHMDIVQEVKTALLPCTLIFAGKRGQGWVRPVVIAATATTDATVATSTGGTANTNAVAPRAAARSSTDVRTSVDTHVAVDVVTSREDDSHIPQPQANALAHTHAHAHTRSHSGQKSHKSLSPSLSPTACSTKESKLKAAAPKSDSESESESERERKRKNTNRESKRANTNTNTNTITNTHTHIVVEVASARASADMVEVEVAAGKEDGGWTPRTLVYRGSRQRNSSQIAVAVVAIAQKKLQEQVISEAEFAIIAAADQKRRQQVEADLQVMIRSGQLMKNLDKPGEYINLMTGAVIRPHEP